MAVMKNQIKILEYLLVEIKLDVNCQNNVSTSVNLLKLCLFTLNFPFLLCFIHKHTCAHAHTHTQRDQTALHVAAYRGNVEAVELLLRHKCNVNIKDKV